jgi:acetylornithine deacetylase
MARPLSQIDWSAVDAAIAAQLPRALETLGALVAEQSVLGAEAGVQRLLRGELERLGFSVAELEIDAAAVAADPASGIPLEPYAGRPVLVGRRPGSSARSLLIQGHVDVVPAGPSTLWPSPAFAATEDDGWLRGRGAADMKGGIAAALLALDALAHAAPHALDGALSFATVIEEECGGNGALAALLAGATADGVLLPEPTALELLVGGVGVLWCEVTVVRGGSHAGEPGGPQSALDVALELTEALRGLAAELEREDAAMRDPAERYLLNIGTLHAGDWISNVPASAVLGVRIGFPTAMSPADAQERVRRAIAAADPSAVVRFTGFRAEGYRLRDDDPFCSAIEAAHRAAHGTGTVRTSGAATNDARFYARRGTSAVCYGPTGRNLHAADEAVELASIPAAARTIARLIPAWLHGTAE